MAMAGSLEKEFHGALFGGICIESLGSCGELLLTTPAKESLKVASSYKTLKLLTIIIEKREIVAHSTV